ncbi:GspH/FimT family pseudopilin [Massilia sp. ST3]|uniref:GspH/FimT family pseudopilin n=1 Tax=Massilia sp. ST3 TaxID=2824903 RepID=UPI001B8380FD|nr:GspH/FimT family pseudopilin [Massilia sp. ST3]MBQ5950271.1 GspH/FimT family pseudopilin [Massilia sp. ST3]
MVSRPAGRARGFTLPELMTVLAVMAILGVMAAPAYADWVATMRGRSAGTDLYTALNRARSEAIKRNAEVTLAPAEDGWQAGWNIAAPGDADRLLDDHPAVAGATIDGPASVIYLPNGRVKGTALPAFDISVGDSAARCVSVDLSGRPSQTNSEC